MFGPEKKQLQPVNGFTVCRGLRTSRFGIPLPYPESTLTPYGRTAKKHAVFPGRCRVRVQCAGCHSSFMFAFWICWPMSALER